MKNENVFKILKYLGNITKIGFAVQTFSMGANKIEKLDVLLFICV